MIGQTLSHYTILEKLGEGGMGVVYKAHDLTLDRVVALKFLPEHVSASGQDSSRFMQEARAAAALTHPNICTIHGIEEHEGRQFIVMEFVDGHMLQEKKHQIPLKQALEIGIQVAEGLAAAHEKGIVHRDIKPENIMIRKDGTVQIMDFGLAKLRGATRLTKEGSTVGTAGYMSPEQVQGMETDHRTDIFSLGVILYELITDGSPFKGVHETAIAYEIVNVDPPPMSSVKLDIDPELDAIVMDCLAKDPADRYQSAAELARNLRRFKRESSRQRMSRVTAARPALASRVVPESAPDIASAPLWKRYFPWTIAGIATLLAAIAGALSIFSSPPTSPSIQALITSPSGINFHSYGDASGPVVISPDGRMIAFTGATLEGKTRLYLRPLDAGSATALAGTDGAYYPFWSYDSKWIGFFSRPTGKLKKVDIAGNPPVTICDAFNGRGGAWGVNDMIIFSRTAANPLMAVSAAGGEPVTLRGIDTSRNESSQRWPQFLPDGKHYLYFSRTASFGAEAEGDAIMAASIDGGPSTFVVNSSSNAQFSSGYLLYMRGSSLLAQRMNESSLTLEGDAMSVAEGVINDPGFSLGVFSASRNGILVYQTGEGLAGARMVIVNRQGKELSFVGDIIEHFWVRISPEGKRIVMGIFEPKSRTQNVWMYDINRGGRSRFTTGLSADINPVWSPDGKKIAYTSIVGDDFSVHIRPAAGGGADETIITTREQILSSDWSPDGTTLCIDHYSPQTQSNISLLSVGGDGKLRPFVQTAYNEFGGRFSPDGKWIAYGSDETGQMEVFVRPFPGPGVPLKITTTGGRTPTWRRDGRELFYISNDNKTMAVEIRPAGTTLDIGRTTTLFARTPIMAEYEPFADGQRFLVNRLIEPKATEPVTIVTNWTAKLKR